jgi:collagenase-like PrtC family protease
LNLAVERIGEELPTSVRYFVHDSAPLACAKQTQLGWILNGKVPQQDGIHQAENRGIRADAKSEGEDRDDSESGILCQHAKAKFEVLPE